MNDRATCGKVEGMKSRLNDEMDRKATEREIETRKMLALESIADSLIRMVHGMPGMFNCPCVEDCPLCAANLKQREAQP